MSAVLGPFINRHHADRPFMYRHHADRHRVACVGFPLQECMQEEGNLIHPVLPIACTNFTYEELCNVLRKLKFGKASGHDDIPSEFWKHVLDNMTAAHELFGLCNHCWNNATIPKAWRLAKVVLLFKKGDATLPENYRPISLFPTE